MRNTITEEQQRIILASLGKMKVSEIALLVKVKESTVYNTAHHAGRSAKTGEDKVSKRTADQPEKVIKHIVAETPEEKKERILQYVREHKDQNTALEMALALGISLDSLEQLAHSVLGIQLETTIGHWIKNMAPSTRVREKGDYSNHHASPIAEEYWQEEIKHQPKKAPKPDDE